MTASSASSGGGGVGGKGVISCNGNNNGEQKSAAEWLSPLFADAAKIDVLVSEIARMVSTNSIEAEEEQDEHTEKDRVNGNDEDGDAHTSVGQVIGLDSMAEMSQYTDVLGSALAARLKAVYISLTPKDPTSDEERDAEGGVSAGSGLLESFEDDNGTRRVIAVEKGLLAQGQRVVLCSAWVESASHLMAAAKLLNRVGSCVVGCAAIQFHANERTRAFMDTHAVFARSCGGGRPPLLLRASPTHTNTHTHPVKAAHTSTRVHKRQRLAVTVNGRASPPCDGIHGAGEALTGQTTTTAAPHDSTHTHTTHTHTRTLPPSSSPSPSSTSSSPSPHDQRAASPVSVVSSSSTSTSVSSVESHTHLSSTPRPPARKRRRTSDNAAAGPLLRITSSTTIAEANNPTEDRYASRSVERTGVHVFCVLDGHGSTLASEYASKKLIPEVLLCLSAVETEYPPPPPGTRSASCLEWRDHVIDQLKSAFIEVDDDFIAQLNPNATQEEARGHWNAGCCAILALIHGTTLFVAHAGDCRAVLGSLSLDATPPQNKKKKGSSPSPPKTHRYLPMQSSATPLPTVAHHTRSRTTTKDDITHAHGHANGHTHAHTHSDANGHADAHDDANGGTHAHAHDDANGRTHAHDDVNGPTRAHGDVKGRTRAHGDVNGHTHVCDGGGGEEEDSSPDLLQASPPPARGMSSHVVARQLTNDHNCANLTEVRLVRERCRGDPCAIRRSSKDTASRSRTAIDRVAGSLAVTRALGDAYLKRRDLSFEPYKHHVPYITAEPEVCVVDLDLSRDRFLILATDGLWERLSNHEAVAVVDAFVSSNINTDANTHANTHTDTHTPPSSAAAATVSCVTPGETGGDDATDRPLRSSTRSSSRGEVDACPPTPSGALVEATLTRVAGQHGMSVRTLNRLPRGSQRRMLHDDICATVICFHPTATEPPKPPSSQDGMDAEGSDIRQNGSTTAEGQEDEDDGTGAAMRSRDGDDGHDDGGGGGGGVVEECGRHRKPKQHRLRPG